MKYDRVACAARSLQHFYKTKPYSCMKEPSIPFRANPDRGEEMQKPCKKF